MSHSGYRDAQLAWTASIATAADRGEQAPLNARTR
jgi:hypothetical protein